LAALQRAHSRVIGLEVASRRPTAWLRSVGDTDWERDPGALVEWTLVAVVVVVVLAFAVWMLAFADVSKLVPQELRPS
jgi:hypothetical protein